MTKGLPPVTIPPNPKSFLPLGMGGSFYGLDHNHYQGESDLLAAMAEALEQGLTHFDTATDYGQGYSERLIGRFMAQEPTRRERIFLASKANLDKVSPKAIGQAIDASLHRLQTDYIDLYYLHWPRTAQDMSPWMEGLELARTQGKIRAIGVSNFSLWQMQQLAQVGRIDACQIGYNLLWRFPEKALLPYCQQQGISVVAYSALAHGILGGRYNRQLEFSHTDQRWSISLFRPEVWLRLFEIVEEFKLVSAQCQIPLPTLALRWLLHQQSVKGVLVSVKNPQQVRDNQAVLNTPVPTAVLVQLSRLSQKALQVIPDEGNPFGYHP